MIYYNFNHANNRMVERGVAYTGIKDLSSRNVCQFTTSFGMQNL